MTSHRSRFGAVVLTGATSGIGEAAAHLLAGLADALVVLGPQPETEVEHVLAGIRSHGPARVRYVAADFASLAEVSRAAREVRSLVSSIDLLINDAGVPGAPERLISHDGFERALQVNALAPALFTRLLVPSLASGARIVNVGSSAHRFASFDFADPDFANDYDPTTAYCRSKLMMVTWSLLLAEEERSTSTTVVTLCPGINDTALSAAMMGRIGGPPTVGAARVLHAATADLPSGCYLEEDRVVEPSGDVLDRESRSALARLFASRLQSFAALE